MSSVITPEPCFICGRRDDGCALMKGNQLRWYCAECGTEIARRANGMPQREFDAAEQRAMQEAGSKGGEYLDSIGKTDLGALDPNEWNVFLITVIRSFGAAMRLEIKTHAPPF
jgi:Family of unknown function (DUF6511)